MKELQNYLLPFLAVLVGYGLVIFLKPKSTRNFKLLLSFSGAFLLALTVFTLLPEVFHFQDNHSHDKEIGIFIIIGILLQIVLEYFSKGAEHGHVHQHSEMQSFPWSLFVSLSIHSVLEGFPLHHHHSLVYGVFIHKLPIAIILTIFFLNAKIDKNKIAVITLKLGIQNLAQLDKIVDKIKNIPDVYSVRRVTS